MASLLGYLVLDQPRQRASHWAQALAPLESPRAPQPLRIDGYYLASEDRALIGLWFLDGDHEPEALVEEVAQLAEIPVVNPGQLSDPDRRALLERLQSADVVVERSASIGEALGDLVRRGRELRSLAPARTITDRSVTAATASVAGGGGGAAGEVATARTTSTRERLQIPPAVAARTATPTRAVPQSPGAAGREVALATGTARGSLMATREEIATASALVSDELDAASLCRPTGTRNDLSTQESERAALEATSDPFALAFEATSPTIEARVLRGTRWMPAQLAQISLDSARLASVAVPRTGDRVFLSLSFSDATVTLAGDVSYVPDDLEAQHTGVAAFQLRLVVDDSERARLAALLRRARAAHAQLRPPMPRAARRFALTWPVTLATSRGSIRAEVYDASSGGMFVQPLRELELSGNVGFSMVLDDLLSSVSGRARVVRQLGAAEARARGLRSGYGLALAELSDPSRLTWERFVARLRRRSTRRVLVGAGAARYEEIAASLQGAGYVVTGGLDPTALAWQVEAEQRPADAAVLDAEWAQGPHPTWMMERLAARGVPCLTTHGDGRRAYGEVDRLLGVAP